MARSRSEPKAAQATAKSKAVRRSLKVFEATFGFYDTAVAAPSQAAALRAWGSHQNLFADGAARLSEDAQAIEAALAHPDEVLRRGVGTADPFSLNPGAPKIPDAPRRRVARATAKREAPPKPADRSSLDRAEAALETLDAERRGEQEQFRQRRDALEAEASAATDRFEEARARARQALERERLAYAKAGDRLEHDG